MGRARAIVLAIFLAVFFALAGVALAATLADEPPVTRECLERSTRILEAPRGPGEPGRFACVEYAPADPGPLSHENAPWLWFGAGVILLTGAGAIASSYSWSGGASRLR